MPESYGCACASADLPALAGSADAGGTSAGAHVHETAVVALERDRDRGRRPVPVLGDDEVRLARPRALLLVGVLTVQQDHHVRVLLDRVVHGNAVGDEVVRPDD